MSRTVPTQSGSGCGSGSRISATTRTAATLAISASGTLTMKIQCQLISVRAPPSAGPEAAPTAPIAAQPLITSGRRWGGKIGSTRPNDVGVTAAAPTACTARAAIRNPSDGAAAHSAEPAPNRSRPVTKTRLRPRMSPSLPAGTSRAANAIA